LAKAAAGADLIFNAWNPPYSDWAGDGARPDGAGHRGGKGQHGAAVMIPGNVYVFGQDMPPVLSPNTPHAATNTARAYPGGDGGGLSASGVKTVILRAGDFLDTEASGNWFDRIIAAKIGKGRLSYPGPLDQDACTGPTCPIWRRPSPGSPIGLDDLPTFTDLTFPGYAMTGRNLAAACEAALGRSLIAQTMSWLPIQVARPFWAEAKHLIEMRYLWERPHRVDGAALDGAAARPDPDARWRTPCAGCPGPACRLEREIDPDQPVIRGRRRRFGGDAELRLLPRPEDAGAA
jgi:hypothetical protein